MEFHPEVNSLLVWRFIIVFVFKFLAWEWLYHIRISYLTILFYQHWVKVQHLYILIELIAGRVTVCSNLGDFVQQCLLIRPWSWVSFPVNVCEAIPSWECFGSGWEMGIFWSWLCREMGFFWSWLCQRKHDTKSNVTLLLELKPVHHEMLPQVTVGQTLYFDRNIKFKDKERGLGLCLGVIDVV